MKMKLVPMLIVGLVLLCNATYLSARSETADSGIYTTNDKEFYLAPEQILFIRPGLELEILDVVIPADLQTEVTFKITDPEGLGLDRTGVTTPGPVSTSFILAFIPAGEDAYLSYTSRIQTSPITGDSAEQASTDSGGTYTELGGGMYMYKFGTVLPADYDADATHTLGMYARRDLREFELDRYVTNELEHWVPSSATSVAAPRDIVTTETCNGRCHDPLALHGGSRLEIGLCILCHNPFQDIDPDTGNSFDMPLMTHKIHMGAQLANGYNIIGYRQSNHDYSDVVYPTYVNDCETCHTGGTPTENFPLVANPAAAIVCDSSGLGETSLTWQHTADVEIYHRLSWDAESVLFTQGGPTGSAPTGKWVGDGTLFDLYDASTKELLLTVPVNATVLGCVGNAPGTFRGEPGVQHTNWLDHPSRKNCGSCHDDVNFETGEGHSVYNLVQPDDTRCGNCHEPYTVSALVQNTNSTGASVEMVDQSNQVESQSKNNLLEGVKSNRIRPDKLNRIRPDMSAANDDSGLLVQMTVGGSALQASGNGSNDLAAQSTAGTAGYFYNGQEFDWSIRGAHTVLYKSVQLPGVVFEFIDITNTNPGDNPTVTFSVGGKNEKYNPADMNRVNLVLNGPNDDFDFYVSERVGSAAVANGDNWDYTFIAPLPVDAAGSYTVSMEGRVDAEVDYGDVIENERDYAQNPLMAFAVTDESPMPRRMIVDNEKCESCHSSLSLHGGNRTQAQYCVTCHRPDLVDIADVPESVNQKWMIHKIHRGADLENGYVVIRSRGTYDFSHIEYTGDLRNCEKCHVNNSQQLPVGDGLLAQITPNFWWDPIEPQSSACLSCHDGDSAAAHAYSNTTFFGEACATCHGEGKSSSVDKVHAR